MNIYIDFDDCLCETALSFTKIVKRMFDKDVPYDNVHFFDLMKSFDLTVEQYEAMMIEGHRPEMLLSIEETPGAAEVVNSWIDAGHDVYIITGRPSMAYEPSRQWLDEHKLDRVKLYCVNKYGRDSFIKDSSFSIELDEYYKMHFDMAVEDSPAAFKHLTHLSECQVAVVDRPWNQQIGTDDNPFPNDRYHRCMNWRDVDAIRKTLEHGGNRDEF